ncbi:hypothetical protein E2562_039158 [Oryza meyeriana var. granulata]|uniref:BTB domain-containing protein n=1 Tax=Oryza meyeriana var. granulata TaxID=110450 RepID=A0A6G1CNT0_9ORYZ|nr:hypothetical protein E2562_039158 [Oryza meyeriana var. granulata]
MSGQPASHARPSGLSSTTRAPPMPSSWAQADGQRDLKHDLDTMGLMASAAFYLRMERTKDSHGEQKKHWGRHRFRIAGYSALKGAAAGHRVPSGTFTVGGFDWVIAFYPEGVTAADMDYVSVYLELKDAGGCVTARAFYDLRLVHPVTGEARSVRWLIDGSTSRVFSSAFSWGHPRFMGRRELEAAGFVRDDRLTIECVINVVQDPVVTAGDAPELEHPPSNILDHLAGLVDDKDTADVTFVVQGEEFPAHRAVLAMRSPVFKAELYGPLKESNARIAVDGMEPAVFRALLHFIYTDTTAAMDDLDDADDKAQMILHLLEAADRYDVERLKLICELMLCKSLTVDTVAATLAMADQHHCQKLKEACVEFLATSKKMEGVLESQGYRKIKLSCPSFMVDLWEIIGRKMASYPVIPKTRLGFLESEMVRSGRVEPPAQFCSTSGTNTSI